jgi:hypothetical protein
MLTCTSYSQNFKVEWGNETKINTLGEWLITADHTGAFFMESTSPFGSYQPAYQIRAFDNKLNQVYLKDYRKEMKGFIFHSFQPLKDKLFLFVKDLDNKEGILRMYGVEIDKRNGNLLGKFIELAKIPTVSIMLVNAKFKASQDSSNWHLVIDERQKNLANRKIHFYTINNHLEKVSNTTIKIDDDPDLFSFEDILVSNANGYFLLAKIFENSTPDKRKFTPEQKGYILRKYDKNGTLVNEVPITNGKDNICIGGKLFTQASGKTIFAGFYSNSSSKEKGLKGIFTASVNENTSNLEILSSMEIGSSISAADEEVKKNKGKTKEDNPDEEFSNDFVIRSIFENKDLNSFLIIAEAHDFSYYNSTTNSGSSGSSGTFHYHNKELMVIHTTGDGILKSIKVIPKYQDEKRMQGYVFEGPSFKAKYFGYFAEGASIAGYSSIATTKWGNSVFIFYNDHTANAGLMNGTTKDIKVVKDFEKSAFYAIRINLSTYELEKKEVFENTKDRIAMPRYGIVSGNQIYLPAMKSNALTKYQLNLGILSLK